MGLGPGEASTCPQVMEGLRASQGTHSSERQRVSWLCGCGAIGAIKGSSRMPERTLCRVPATMQHLLRRCTILHQPLHASHHGRNWWHAMNATPPAYLYSQAFSLLAAARLATIINHTSLGHPQLHQEQEQGQGQGAPKALEWEARRRLACPSRTLMAAVEARTGREL